jgi:hypothetical protein
VTNSTGVKSRVEKENLEFLVKSGAKIGQWGGVEVDQSSIQKVGDCRGEGRLERRPASPERRRV